MTGLLDELKSSVFRFKDYLVSERKLSKNTVEAYYNDAYQFFEYASLENDAKSLEDFFSLEYLDGFLIYLYNKNLDPRSIVRKLSTLSVFMKFMKLEGFINENKSSLLSRPKTPKKLPVYLTVEEIEKFLEAFDRNSPNGVRDRALFELVYSAGLRVSEVSGLDTTSVYFDKLLIKVLGKGDKERYVPLGERAKKELVNYLNIARPLLVKNRKTGAFFINYRGERLTRKGIWKNLKAAAGLAGLDYKNFSVHSLRHSFATHLIQNGADLRSVQSLLGHKSILTTEIYTHLDLEHLRTGYDRYHSHSK